MKGLYANELFIGADINVYLILRIIRCLYDLYFNTPHSLSCRSSSAGTVFEVNQKKLQGRCNVASSGTAFGLDL
jgi:hypothetical protein